MTRKDVSRKKVNSIVNICFLAAQENQKIGGSSALSGYLHEFRRKRYFASVMKSNLIPYKNNSSLWESNKTGFTKLLNERLKIIIDAFEKESGLIIFDKVTD